jgi:hypothetical protein
MGKQNPKIGAGSGPRRPVSAPVTNKLLTKKPWNIMIGRHFDVARFFIGCA